MTTESLKIPPHDIDCEVAVLGGCMIFKDAILDVIEILHPDCFYKEIHKTIFQAMINLLRENNPIDVISVTQELRKTNKLDEVGGPFYISSLANQVSSTAHLEYYSRIIFEKFMLRKIIELSDDAIKESFSDGDCFEIADNLVSGLEKIQNFIKSGLKESKHYLQNVKEIVRENESIKGTTGVLTGIKEFDDFSLGLHKGNLIVVAGETSQGKTALSINIALSAQKQTNVVFFTYEMTGEELVARFLSNEIGISAKTILYSKLWDSEREKVLNYNDDWCILIDDCRDNSFEYLERTARQAVVKNSVGLIIIDYLQLIRIKTGKRMELHQEVGEIANRLKSLAKSLNVPIILNCQLRRSQDPKPSLSRLKNSGDIENAADVVWLIWRPECYGLGDIELDMKGFKKQIGSEMKAHHIIAKGRSIGTTEFVTRFNPKTMSFDYFDINAIDEDNDKEEYPF